MACFSLQPALAHAKLELPDQHRPAMVIDDPPADDEARLVDLTEHVREDALDGGRPRTSLNGSLK